MLLPIAHFVRGAGDAITTKIVEVTGKRATVALVADNARLHRAETSTVGDKTIGANTRHAATSEARSTALAGRDLAGAGNMPAGLLRGGERLSDERPCPLGLAGADASRPDAEIVIPAHGVTRCEVQVSLKIFSIFRVRTSHV